MKNRILWIFDSAEPVDELPAAVEPVEVEEEAPLSFVELPWALFGAIGAQQRADFQRKYELAFERSRAQREQRNEEALRFERLIAGLEAQE